METELDISYTEEQFAQLAPNKQRVQLAKDVIKQLYEHKMNPQKGDYITIWDYKHEYLNQQLNEVAKQVPCTVCAIGALFLAEVLICNHATVFDSTRNSFRRHRLDQYFTRKQQGMIESAFEESDSFALESGCSIKDAKAAAYFSKELSSSKRMSAIMQNIIDNDGEFKP